MSEYIKMVLLMKKIVYIQSTMHNIKKGIWLYYSNHYWLHFKNKHIGVYSNHQSETKTNE